MLTENITNIALLAILGFNEYRHRKSEADLLDRLMSRDFAEYKAASVEGRRPLRRFVLTDAQMAAIEAGTKKEAMGDTVSAIIG